MGRCRHNLDARLSRRYFYLGLRFSVNAESTSASLLQPQCGIEDSPAFRGYPRAKCEWRPRLWEPAWSASATRTGNCAARTCGCRRPVGAGVRNGCLRYSSEVIRAGKYCLADSSHGHHGVDGACRLYNFCESHGVLHRACGRLIVAGDDAEAGRSRRSGVQGEANGVPGLELLDEDAAPRTSSRLHGRASRATHRHRGQPCADARAAQGDRRSWRRAGPAQAR